MIGAGRDGSRAHDVRRPATTSTRRTYEGPPIWFRTIASSRRAFLQNGLGLSGSLVLGCSSQPLEENGQEPFAGGENLGQAAFVGESEAPLDVAFNSGLDGRLYTDLSRLDDDHLITPNDTFYVRTRYPDLLVPESPWRIRVTGASEPGELSLNELESFIAPRGVHLMECSGNARGASFGLLSSAEWNGIPVLDVLARFLSPAGAVGVLIAGFDEHSQPSANNHSTPGASWVFTFDDLARTGAFLATHMNAEPLPPDHGAPVRLLVPGWYGCTCIKWVNELRFVTADEPATSQMAEFASRTHQNGVPELARDYLPAEIDVAAMPVRVEKWRIEGAIRYRVVGIEWGGSAPASALEIRFGDGAWEPVERRSLASEQSWRLWEHEWQAPARGIYAITLRVPDTSTRTRRLDTGYYLREVSIDEL